MTLVEQLLLYNCNCIGKRFLLRKGGKHYENAEDDCRAL